MSYLKRKCPSQFLLTFSGTPPAKTPVKCALIMSLRCDAGKTEKTQTKEEPKEYLRIKTRSRTRLKHRLRCNLGNKIQQLLVIGTDAGVTNTWFPQRNFSVMSSLLHALTRCHPSPEWSGYFSVVVNASDMWKANSGKCPHPIFPTVSRVIVWKQHMWSKAGPPPIIVSYSAHRHEWC